MILTFLPGGELRSLKGPQMSSGSHSRLSNLGTVAMYRFLMVEKLLDQLYGEEVSDLKAIRSDGPPNKQGKAVKSAN